jgi:TPR repeat protein
MAQYGLNMLIYCMRCESGDKDCLVDAARWIRKAAMQGFMDTQYEFGETFRHGVFCDHIYMRFARKYIRRASMQGHGEAIARMKQLRSCVMCDADEATLACSLCSYQARYCDFSCGGALVQGWRRGGECKRGCRHPAHGHTPSYMLADDPRPQGSIMRFDARRFLKLYI